MRPLSYWLIVLLAALVWMGRASAQSEPVDAAEEAADEPLEDEVQPSVERDDDVHAAPSAESSVDESAVPSEPPDPVRALYDLGNQAMQDARFAAARDVFLEGMGRAPNAAFAYMLALSFRATGQSAESIVYSQRLLSGEFGVPPADRRAVIERWVAEERAKLATVTLTLRGPGEARVRDGGRTLGTLASDAPMRLRVNPGRRTLTLRAEGYEPLERTFYAEPSATLGLNFRLEPSTSVFERPAFWITVASIVVVGVAVGIIAAYAPYAEPLMNDGPFDVVEALSAPLLSP